MVFSYTLFFQDLQRYSKQDMKSIKFERKVSKLDFTKIKNIC